MASAEVPHIPAWKRLGLKLKNVPDAPVLPTNLESSSSAKKHSLDEPASTPSPSKRPKTSAELPSSQSKPQGPSTPIIKQKKSVTFTPDTKTKDGDSIKQLFSAWAADQKAYDDFCNPPAQPALSAPAPPKVEEDFPSNVSESERRVQRVKKAKPAKKTSKASNAAKCTEAGPPPAIEYLRTYCESRESWKFSKNHQVWLLKNALNLDKLPTAHSERLYSYLDGLQGAQAWKDKLREQALAIREKDRQVDPKASKAKVDMSADRKRKEMEDREDEYQAALARYVQERTARDLDPATGSEEALLLGVPLESMKVRMATRLRAEAVLDRLGEKSDAPIHESEVPEPDSQKRVKLNDGSKQPVSRRRRKQRTSAVDDSSSSSSSDSDDSSDEDSSDSDDDDSSSKDQGKKKSTSGSEESDSSDSSDDTSSSEDSSSEDEDAGEGKAEEESTSSSSSDSE